MLPKKLDDSFQRVYTKALPFLGVNWAYSPGAIPGSVPAQCPAGGPSREGVLPDGKLGVPGPGTQQFAGNGK
jgi:hypothetical protein